MDTTTSTGDDSTEFSLCCCICPRKPTFSDQSHLLTHIQSKGHLSHLYKSRLHAANDPAVKQDLDTYEEWYTRNNVQELERERLSLKEKKKKYNRDRIAGAANNASPAGPPRPPSHVSRRAHEQPRSRNRMTVDPQIMGHVKMEQFSPIFPSYAAFQLPGQQTPQMLRLNPMSAALPGSPMLKQESPDSDDEEEYSVYGNVLNRGVEYYPIFYGPPLISPYQHQQSDSNQSLYTEDCDMDVTVIDGAHLKGVFWPGMGRFDSATPDQKRKRNQKKNASVLRHLQLTSEMIEPDEWVFDASFSLRKKRIITGNPEPSDDLIEGESSPEPDYGYMKRTQPHRRPRPALLERDINSGRVLQRRRVNHSGSTGLKTIKRESAGTTDDDLTYRPRKSRRAGFSIHCDDSGPDISLEQPLRLNMLNTSLHGRSTSNAFPTNPYPLLHTNTPQQGWLSWGMLNSAARPNGHQNWMASAQARPYLTPQLFGTYPRADERLPYTVESLFQSPPTNASVESTVDHGKTPRENNKAGDVSLVTPNPLANAADKNWSLAGALNRHNKENVNVAALDASTQATINPLFMLPEQTALDDDQVTLSADEEH